MTLQERIERIVEYSGLSIPKFANRVGFKTPQAVRELLSGNTKTLSDAAQYKITSAYPELNAAWLLTGEGEMLNAAKSLPSDSSQSNAALLDLLRSQQEMLRSQQETIRSLSETVRQLARDK